MRKPKYILFISASIFVLTIAFVIIESYLTSKIPFISTTGFYIEGIDPDDPNLISAWAESFDGNNKKQVYCLQQYRSSVDYIYQDWRSDMKFYLRAEIVSIEMPERIWDKVKTVWFKTGEHVFVYNKDQMIADWLYSKTESGVKFTSDISQVPINSFADGFHCFLNAKLFNIILAKYLIGINLLFALGLLILHVRIELKQFFKLMLQKSIKRIKKNKTFWTKFLVFFGGILVAFILLEASLRILGYFHKKQHIVKNYSIAEDSQNIVICLGDSFTEGFGSTEGNSYPEVLKKLINSESNIEYEVANFGQSGKNTTQIKDEFFKYLENHTPELVVIMAGSANYWNYYGFEDHNKLIYQIRTFKLIKLIWNELFGNEIGNENDGDLFYTEENYVENRNDFYEKFKADSYNKNVYRIKDSLMYYNNRDLIYYNILNADSLCFDSIFISGLDDELKQLCLIANFYKGVDIDIDSLDSEYYRALYYYIKSMNESPNYKRKYLCLSINESPYFEDVYFQLLKTKFIIPVLPNDFERKRVCILDSLNYYRAKFGEDIDLIKAANVYIEEDLDLNIETEKINSWVKNDLEDIIIKCQEKEIRVVLMTYPFKSDKPIFWPVNNIIRELSISYNLKLIDNFNMFKKFKDNYDSYYVSDGHCNDRGYAVISNGLFKLLKDEKMLKGFENKNVK